MIIETTIKMQSLSFPIRDRSGHTYDIGYKRNKNGQPTGEPQLIVTLKELPMGGRGGAQVRPLGVIKDGVWYVKRFAFRHGKKKADIYDRLWSQLSESRKEHQRRAKATYDILLLMEHDPTYVEPKYTGKDERFSYSLSFHVVDQWTGEAFVEMMDLELENPYKKDEFLHFQCTPAEWMAVSTYRQFKNDIYEAQADVTWPKIVALAQTKGVVLPGITPYK